MAYGQNPGAGPGQRVRIALVGAELEENLPIRYLAASARAAGHEADVLPYSHAAQLPTIARWVKFHDPPLVGLSMAFQHRAREFLALADRLRAEGWRGHLTAGGHFATFAWREILANHPAVDTVIRHEGEDTLVELAAALGEPERWPLIPGVACRGAGGHPVAAPPRRVRDDLDALPFPVRADRLPEHCGLPFATLVGSRGCFADCNYCCITAYHQARPGKRYRERTPASIAAEMGWLWHERDARVFCFHDEDLFLPRPGRTRARLEAIRAALDRHGVGRIATVGKARPDCVEADLLRWASDELGLVRIYLGIENGSEHGLATLGRGTDLATCRRALGVLGEAGAYACFNLLLFDPYTTLADVDDNFAFMEEFAEFPYNFCRTEVYSGTHFERTLRREGRLLGSYLGWGYRIPDERVELLFRLVAVAFSHRNFGTDGLCGRLSNAGYEAALALAFRPSPANARAAEGIREVTRRSNLHALEVLRRLRAFVGPASAARDGAAAQTVAVECALEVNRVSHGLGVDLDGWRAGLSVGGRVGERQTV